MLPSPVIGTFYHWLGGLASASNFIPFRPIKRWSWEIYWIIQGFAAWILAPLALGLLLVPHLFAIIAHAPAGTLRTQVIWGALWGIGGLTFGLSVRYLGIALGYAISLGLCTAFGTLMPPLFAGQLGTIAGTRGGRTVLLGVGVCLVAIAVNGAAGYFKERDTSAEDKAIAGERDFSFGKGLAVAIFAGIMSACFAYGLDAGKPLAAIARRSLLSEGRTDLWQNLPVLVVVLWGGFATNLLWSAYLIVKNRSAAQFIGAPGSNPMGTSATTGETLQYDPRALMQRLSSTALLRNYSLALLAGVTWYFQFFFYSMGDTLMGKYSFSSWALHMASIIIFATLWSIVLREWRGTSPRTYLLMILGLSLLVFSTLMIGYGDYLSAVPA